MATTWHKAARHGWLLAAALATSCTEAEETGQEPRTPLAQRSCELPCGRGVQRCTEDGSQCTECVCVVLSDATILQAAAGAGGDTAAGSGGDGPNAQSQAGTAGAGAAAGSQGGSNAAGCAGGGSDC